MGTINKVGSAEDTGDNLSPASISTGNNKVVNFSIVLKKPGDKYSFTVDVKNFGTIPAKANLIVTGLDAQAQEYLTWSVTGISENESIAVGASKTLTVTIEYKSGITTLPENDFSTNLSAEIVAVQE